MICYSSLRQPRDDLKTKLYHVYTYQYWRHVFHHWTLCNIFIYLGVQTMFEQHFNFNLLGLGVPYACFMWFNWLNVHCGTLLHNICIYHRYHTPNLVYINVKEKAKFSCSSNFRNLKFHDVFGHPYLPTYILNNFISLCACLLLRLMACIAFLIFNMNKIFVVGGERVSQVVLFS